MPAALPSPGSHRREPATTSRVRAASRSRATGLARALAVAGWLAVPCALVGAPAGASDTGASGGPRPDGPLLRSQTVQTTIAGLRLHPLGKRYHRNLDDYDILLLDDGRRFVPLLRTLRLLGLEPTADDSGYVFQATSAGPVRVDPRRGALAIADSTTVIETRTGVSDVTSQGEIWIPEEAMARLVEGTISWDENRYEYDLAISEELDWNRASGRPVAAPSAFGDAVAYGESFRSLREISRPPRLTFARFRGQSALQRSPGPEGTTASLSNPSLDLWGEALGGAFSSALAMDSNGLGGGRVRLRQAAWTTWRGETELSAGDSQFGLSELVFPSVSLLGFRANGLLGGVASARDQSRMGLRNTYSPVQTFRGTAPLGSEVTLFLNGHEVDVGPVRSDPEAAPGEGVWTAEGQDLLMNRVNRVRVRVKRPDGRIDETEQELLGTSDVLPAGQSAFLLAGGTARDPAGGISPARFFGGRLTVGLPDHLTAGFAGGWQERLLSERAVPGAIDEGIPPRSAHGSARVAWSPAGRALLDADLGVSRLEAERRTGVAWRAGGEVFLGDFQLRPEIFRYGAAFHDGGTRPIHDRSGGAFQGFWRSGGYRVEIAGVSARDNLDGRHAFTNRLAAAHLGGSMRSLIPGAAIDMGADLAWAGPEEIARRLGLGVTSTTLRDWRLRAVGSLSRERPAPSEDVGTRRRDLLLGLPVPILGTETVSGPEVGIERRVGSAWTVGLEHRSSRSWGQTLFDVTRRESRAGALQLRAAGGYDWVRRQAVLDLRGALFLDPTGRSRLLCQARRDPRDWSILAALQLDLLAGFRGTKPYRVADAGVDPDGGGVRGQVFLDANGNGIRDRGESGLPDVGIASEGGRKALSSPDGVFLLPTGSDRRRITVGIQPSTLSAIYTPTTPPQEEIVIRPGLFTEVDFGVAALGTISGRLLMGSGAEQQGVAGVQLEAVEPTGKTVRTSVTAKDGSYVLESLKPGRYLVRVVAETLPPKLELENGEVTIEVRCGSEPFDATGVDFGARSTAP